MMKRFLSKLTFFAFIATAAAGTPPPTSKASGDSSDITTFKFRFPNFTATRSGTTTTFNVNAIAGGGTGQSTQTAAFDALSPGTTKGDLLVFNGTNNVRLGVGTNNYVLTADSSQSSGVKWASVTAASAVNARASTAAGQVLTSGADSIIDFGTVVYDSNSAVTTGSGAWKFTAPTTGKYHITATVRMNTSGSGTIEMYLAKNSSGEDFSMDARASSTVINNLSGSISIDLTAGDYIRIIVYQGTGGNRTLTTVAGQNWVTIDKVD